MRFAIIASVLFASVASMPYAEATGGYYDCSRCMFDYLGTAKPNVDPDTQRKFFTFFDYQMAQQQCYGSNNCHGSQGRVIDTVNVYNYLAKHAEWSDADLDNYKNHNQFHYFESINGYELPILPRTPGA